MTDAQIERALREAAEKSASVARNPYATVSTQTLAKAVWLLATAVGALWDRKAT